MTTFSFTTEDSALAWRIHQLVVGNPTTVLPLEENPAPVVTAPAPVVTAPAPVVTAPAPPPAASDVHPDDKAVLDLGWSMDHVKQAATKYTAQLGAAGAAGLKKMLGEFGADKIAVSGKVGPNCLLPRHYPAIVERLNASTT